MQKSDGPKWFPVSVNQSKFTSSTVGFKTNFPSILPTRITPIGPFQGISDSISAAEEAFAAMTSGSCFPSDERTFTMI